MWAKLNLMLFYISVGVKVNPKGRGESDVQKNKIRGMQNKQSQHIYTASYAPQMYTIFFLHLPWKLVFPGFQTEFIVLDRTVTEYVPERGGYWGRRL